MWQMSTTPMGMRQTKHIFVGETRIATKNNWWQDTGTEYEKYNTYWYHADHLGSAQLVSNWKGEEYERIEYTQYGEIWVEKVKNGHESINYRFTGNEMDSETGLYYFGARYLDPKYSRWLSTDPALGDYIPSAGKGNSKDAGNLPGMGGVYNHINFHLYHYAGNNPVKYVDPDGCDIQTVYFAGAGGKLILGADVSAGVSWDDNGNVALTLTGNLGVGVEAQIDLPVAPSVSTTPGVNLNELKGLGAIKVDGNASLTGLETSVGIGIGMSIDNESSQLSGCNIGTIGGGVTFVSGSIHVILKHGVGDLIKQCKNIDSNVLVSEIKDNNQIPAEIKSQVLQTVEEK